MKSKIILIILIIPLKIYSAFKDPGWSARPLALGRAFVAISDDVNAILYNPAGLTQTYLNSTIFSYTKPHINFNDLGLNYYFLASNFKLKKHFFGIGFTELSSPIYKEDTIIFNYAYPVRLTSIGINIKWLSHKYILDKRSALDPLFAEKNSKSVMSFDSGILLKLNNFKFGFAVNDINSPDVGIKTEDKIFKTLKLGLSQSIFFDSKKIIYSIEAVKKKIYHYNVGIETWLFDEVLAIRFGTNGTKKSINEFSTGIGYIFNLTPKILLQISYAVVFPIQMRETYGTHRIAIEMKY